MNATPSHPPNRPPLVSVVIPAYNAGRFVGQAVRSALDQTYGNREVIVVDDGSTDDTKLVLSQFAGQVRYLHQENRGASAARNTGVRAAEGAIICFLDADDLWALNKLELQVAFLQEHRDIGLVSGQHEEFRDNGAPYVPFVATQDPARSAARTFPHPAGFLQLVRSNFIRGNTVMARKECFDKVGLFDVNLAAAEDWDMWIRIAAHFSIACLPWVMSKKRLHGSNKSADLERMANSRIKIVEKNQSLFPGLAPAAVWDEVLGKYYLRAGCTALVKNRPTEARQMARRSLESALTIKAALVVLATFMTRPAVEMALRVWRNRPRRRA